MRQRIAQGTAYWLWRLTAFLAQRLPQRVLYPLAVTLGEIAYLAWGTKRRIAKQNFAHVLDRPAGDRAVARVARRSFRNFAKYVVEIMRFPRLRAEDLEHLVAIEGWEHIRGAMEKGRGIIFVSIHFGNFEVGGARVAGAIPLNVIADDLSNQRLMDLLVGNRAHKNINIHTPNGAARKVLSALRRNEMVGVMMDLGPRAFAFNTVNADFFGAPAAFPTVAADLARVSGAPIVVGAVVRQHDNTFRGVALPPIWVDRARQAAEETARVTSAIADALEGLIRPCPDQWYIFRPMWPAELSSVPA
ncbi:MAG: lysophospholipid acyltransferase family protein [Chloroflexota bacterium]|nr:lysophospholipid acyltransferase family protein [Chloroflexota bacterium]MDE3101817.1 lysophospholipid acyltransferase family protein [Chloroflexota bacterium]